MLTRDDREAILFTQRLHEYRIQKLINGDHSWATLTHHEQESHLPISAAPSTSTMRTDCSLSIRNIIQTIELTRQMILFV